MDNTQDEKGTPSPARKTLSLRTAPKGVGARRGMAIDRTKTVVVEKRKRRTLHSDKTIQQTVSTTATTAAKPKIATTAANTRNLGRVNDNNLSDQASVNAIGSLTKGEVAARSKALTTALKRQAEELQEATREQVKRLETERKLALEKQQKELLEPKPETIGTDDKEPITNQSSQTLEQQLGDGLKAEVRADTTSHDGVAHKDDDAPKTTDTPSPTSHPLLKGKDEDTGSIKNLKKEDAKPIRKFDEVRRRRKLTVTSALNDDDANQRIPSMAARKRRREKAKAKRTMPAPRVSREVIIPDSITVQELAIRMSDKAGDVINFLMNQGQTVKISDVIDADTAQLVAEEFGHKVKRFSASDIEIGLFSKDDEDPNSPPRPPVVTIMGHVDHGKTSLLDALRKTNIASGEMGGITQHIGAYQVTYGDHLITFIDTPGHAAFSAMRARGANLTDIVILVVAADEGIRPQTIEAINHAKAANVPIIVAINKIDKQGANPDRIRNELLQHDLMVESLGGEILEVELSALTGKNLNTLIEVINLQAEIMELRGNPDQPAEGVILEARLDNRRGVVSSIVVQRGALKVGDMLVAGLHSAKVKAMISDRGKPLTTVSPSEPAEVLGFSGAPKAGERFSVVETEARAKEIIEYRRELYKTNLTDATMRGSLEHMMSQLKENRTKEFMLVIKTDVQGSLEAITDTLRAIGNEEVRVNVVHSGVGGISEADVSIAATSSASLIAFNVRANKQAIQEAERFGVEIRYYNVIYDLTDDVKAAMSGMLAPQKREHYFGKAEILEVFNIHKIGRIAGCLVNEGNLERGARVRLIRDNVVIHEGSLASLKRFKDEVKSVTSGQECGMHLNNYQDIKVGDSIECFKIEEIARML